MPRVDDAIASTTRRAVVGTSAHLGSDGGSEDTLFHIGSTGIIAREAAVGLADALLAGRFVVLLFVGRVCVSGRSRYWKLVFWRENREAYSCVTFSISVWWAAVFGDTGYGEGKVDGEEEAG
ncbi:MAG: hypothetical protein Q9170_004571, partial [Blastenia crenularia]